MPKPNSNPNPNPPSQTSIKIIIPVHDEEGWTTACSPDAGASLKARLQEGKSPKSPATRRRMEERAAQLHQLHVEATQQRAAKENRRAKEVVAARLRSAAASRQNLLARFEEQASHREEKQREEDCHYWLCLASQTVAREPDGLYAFWELCVRA